MKRDFIYLASSSPRRRQLLEQIGVDCRTRPAELSEACRAGEAPAAYVLRLAEEKANAVWQALGSDERRPVLAADTAVVIDDRLLGKPAHERDALASLEQLSGRSHWVLTAVALRYEETLVSRLNRSAVTFRRTTEQERRAYCATGEPYDKAGAYGIQGLAAAFIEHIEGSYSGVMGLPLAETASLLAPFGLPRWLAEPEQRA